MGCPNGQVGGRRLGSPVESELPGRDLGRQPYCGEDCSPGCGDGTADTGEEVTCLRDCEPCTGNPCVRGDMVCGPGEVMPDCPTDCTEPRCDKLRIAYVSRVVLAGGLESHAVVGALDLVLVQVAYPALVALVAHHAHRTEECGCGAWA